ncbi:lipopolysaccharide-induced tumor necrosis factor-alpha factor homolog [Wyeomyia smithii]|uniref:lipopolysaccharide-induced tumor necrosis factor-alpha factor homolog n=1 Tax=Wyeomyia smithii TaxID=174621 RepID=UPI002467CF25|nr:lipopolysaccharide-induced tumor necrosis factor-alpha factor homolog [Wyeomyia smithii]
MQQPTVVIAGAPAVGPDPTHLVCPSCRATIRTRVEHDSTTKTHIIALLLFVFCCWPCICVPYCMNSCKDANHYCPNCNAFIGSHKH